MSLIAKMYVEDKEINILDFKFRFTRAVDEHGYPMGRPNGTVFEIIFETTADQSFMAWAVATDMTKHVKIVVSPVSGTSKSRIIELYDVHCVHFKNNFNAQNGEPMTTLIHLTPAIMIDDGYKVLDHYWKKTDLNTNNVTPTVLDKEEEAEITKISWLKLNTEEISQQVRVGEKVDLAVEIANPKGGTAEIALEKEDGTKLKTLQEAVGTDGKIKIKALKIEQAWISDAQKIIAHVTYEGKKKKSELLEIGRIVSGVWLNEKNEELTQNAEKLNDTFFYGQKAKIKINTVHLEKDTIIKVTLKGLVEGKEVDFPKIQTGKADSKIEVELKVTENNEAISEEIYIHPLWYNEEIEEYDYINHITKIEATKSLTLIFDATLVEDKKAKLVETTIENLPQVAENQLRPVTYRRNYEELLGLYEEGSSSKKTREDNYENKFINFSTAIKTIAHDFIVKITDEKTPDSKIEELVKESAGLLWDIATVEQAIKLDDRPLYWARNKMQTWLKRHPNYKDDYDFEKSIVTKGSDLDDMIVLFEEKSRNYTGIDFSKAVADPVKIAEAESKMIQANLLLREATKSYLNNTNNKEIESEYELAKKAHKEATDTLEKSKKVFKVLITGFDPFQLNPKFEKGNKNAIQTFNPSGIVALSFFNKKIGNIFVQTCIFPTRYEDFDAGVIEKVAKQHLPKVDMMMTTSRNNVSYFDIEKYAIAYREGFYDNKGVGSSSPEYNFDAFISNNSKEIRETTLPIIKIFGKENEIVVEGEIVRYDTSKDTYAGSGGAYLSNEIMYRTTKLRDELGLKDERYVGHFHLGNLKTNGSSDIKKTPVMIKVVETIISSLTK